MVLDSDMNEKSELKANHLSIVPDSQVCESSGEAEESALRARGASNSPVTEIKTPEGRVVCEGVGLENNIYTNRFSAAQEAMRRTIWEVLTTQFLQQFIPANSVVVDIGAGDGLFLQYVQAKRRIAVDLSEHVQALTKHGIEVLQVPATELCEHVPEGVDIIFMSNFLEHLPDRALLIEIVAACRKVLKPTGRLMILQPNIRYVGPAYWDYIDHHIALTEHSLVEALEVTGYRIERLIPRFLPYTAKSNLGRLMEGSNVEGLVKFYLKTPLLWRFFGKQTFVVATPR